MHPQNTSDIWRPPASKLLGVVYRKDKSICDEMFKQSKRIKQKIQRTSHSYAVYLDAQWNNLIIKSNEQTNQ